jgi:transcriptional regulator with XRE-family HTH domain
MRSKTCDLRTIGGRFSQERQRLGFGVQYLADLCDVTRQQINRIERNGNAPGGEVLQKFALAGADVHYILTGARALSSDAGSTHVTLPRELVQMCWRELNVHAHHLLQMQAQLGTGKEPYTEGIEDINTLRREVNDARAALDRALWPKSTPEAG